MRKPTINDVAKLAEVSTKTVSRVLNNEPHVRPNVYAKVQQAVTELNYQPNQSARRLAGNKTYIIGLVYDGPDATYISEVQTGILSECLPLGYDLLVHPCDYFSKNLEEEVMGLIEKQRVDGLILIPPIADKYSLIKKLIEKNVTFARNSPASIPGEDIRVSSNERTAALNMVKYLASIGHKKIAFISGPPHHSSSKERLLGYRDGLKYANLPYVSNYLENGDYTFDSGLQCAKKLLDLYDRPTAIFASNDDMAQAVLVTAHAKGINIPTELSVAGFDDLSYSQQVWPSLTTIKQPIIEQSKLSTEILIKKILKKPLKNPKVSLNCELIVRNSTSQIKLSESG